MTVLDIVDLPADRLPGEALVVPLFEDQRPLAGPVGVVDWRLDGALTRMILAGEMTGKHGERLALRTNAKFAAPWVLLSGCGSWQTLDRARYLQLIERLLKTAAKAGIEEVALCLPPAEHVDPPELERMVREALVGSVHPAVCRLSRVAHL